MAESPIDSVQANGRGASASIKRVRLIPPELRELPRWACWQERPSPGGKPGKPPIQARTGPNGSLVFASVNDPATWATFPAAERFWREHLRDQEPPSGLSFALYGDGVIGVDLDDCRDPATRRISEWAADLIRRLNTYTEISPSGKGLRLFLRGSLPSYGRKKGQIEVYDNHKFMTVTGRMLVGDGVSFHIEDRPDELRKWHREVFGDGATTTRKSNSPLVLNDPPVTDERRLANLFRRFRKAEEIYNGEGDYLSQSEADLALANYAAMAGWSDQEVCDLLVEARTNADQPVKHLGYFERTIAKAREGRQEESRQTLRAEAGDRKQGAGGRQQASSEPPPAKGGQHGAQGDEPAAQADDPGAHGDPDQANATPANGGPAPPGRPQPPGESEEPEGDKEKVVDALVRIGRQLPLFHDGDGGGFALTPLSNQRTRAVPITPRGLGGWLRMQYFREQGKGVADGSLNTAIATLHSIAEFEGLQERVFVRLAEAGGAIYLDLAGDDGSVVEITPNGWAVIRHPPVQFHQPGGLRPLPKPARGGGIEPLWRVVNVERGDRILVAAWLLMALNPRGPYPGLFLHGQQGCAKSTTGGYLRKLIDPNKCPLRQPPRDEDALVLAARNGLVVGVDNLSHIDQGLSDSLCRLMTGGGIGKRRLYSDAEEVLLDVKRPLLVTGIPELATAGDLADRVISLTLPPIPGEQRALDSEVADRFGKFHADMLGALLDGVVLALKDSGKSRPTTLTRMADFEVWAWAGLSALGFRQSAFLNAYRSNKAQAATAVLEASPVAVALVNLMDRVAFWKGTTSFLLELLKPVAGDGARDRSWPKTPRGLSGALRRLAPALDTVAGLRLTFGEREGHDRQRIITVTKAQREPPSAPPAPPASRKDMIGTPR
jgi:hypothetical protein